MPRLLPLFPLQLVAFPGSAIPLHIFEERYREMVGAAEANGSEFGIVPARDGGVVNAGCTVVVEKVLERYDDGRFDVLTRGRRRFMLLSLNQDKAWLRGEVDFFDDEDWTPVPAEVRARARAAYTRAREALRGAGQEFGETELDPDAPNLGFQLAHATGDLDFQNRILRCRSEAERLNMFVTFANEYAESRLYSAKMKKVAPMNGSGHKPAGF